MIQHLKREGRQLQSIEQVTGGRLLHYMSKKITILIYNFKLY